MKKTTLSEKFINWIGRHRNDAIEHLNSGTLSLASTKGLRQLERWFVVSISMEKDLLKVLQKNEFHKVPYDTEIMTGPLFSQKNFMEWYGGVVPSEQAVQNTLSKYEEFSAEIKAELNRRENEKNL